MQASAVAQQLQPEDIISKGDLKEINQTQDAKEQNMLLHTKLEEKCTAEALMKVCDIIISVEGNPKMKQLGQDMKDMLESRFCMCLCMQEMGGGMHAHPVFMEVKPGVPVYLSPFHMHTHTYTSQIDVVQKD